MTETGKNTYLKDNLGAIIAILGVLGFGGYQATTDQVSSDQVQTEIKQWDARLTANMQERFDSTISAMVNDQVAPRLIAEAVHEDAATIKKLVKYGVDNMAKDSANEIWKREIDELLELKASGCGAYFHTGQGVNQRLWYRDCYEGDLMVREGKPADRPDIVKCNFSYRADGSSLIHVNLRRIQYFK